MSSDLWKFIKEALPHAGVATDGQAAPSSPLGSAAQNCSKCSNCSCSRRADFDPPTAENTLQRHLCYSYSCYSCYSWAGSWVW